MERSPWSEAASNNIVAPVVSARAVDVNDTVDLPFGPTKRIWSGSGGNIALIAAGDTDAVTWVNVPAGMQLDVVATRIMSTNTTATNILALY